MQAQSPAPATTHVELFRVDLREVQHLFKFEEANRNFLRTNGANIQVVALMGRSALNHLGPMTRTGRWKQLVVSDGFRLKVVTHGYSFYSKTDLDKPGSL